MANSAPILPPAAPVLIQTFETSAPASNAARPVSRL